MIDGLGYQPILHQCNTSGLLNYPEAHLDMVRSGIGCMVLVMIQKSIKS